MPLAAINLELLQVVLKEGAEKISLALVQKIKVHLLLRYITSYMVLTFKLFLMLKDICLHQRSHHLLKESVLSQKIKDKVHSLYPPR